MRSRDEAEIKRGRLPNRVVLSVLAPALIGLAACNASQVDGGDGGGIVIDTSNTSLGVACTSDADCKSGLTCLLAAGAAFDGEGPAGGVCSLNCTADVTSCAALDPSASCVQVNSQAAYCLQGCQLGPYASSQPKCHGRADVACTELSDGTTGASSGMSACFPTCRADADCGKRTCDLATGLCTDAAKPGSGTDPIGTSCDPNAAASTCAGICVSLGSLDGGAASEGICSGFCSLGQVGCGENPSSSGPFDSMCFFPPNIDSDLGDQGFCGQLCDCDADCRDVTLLCVPLPAEMAKQSGRAGACSPPTDASGAPLAGIACTGRPSTDGGVDSGPRPGSGDVRSDGGADSGPTNHGSQDVRSDAGDAGASRRDAK